MTRDEMKEALVELGWTQATLAARLGISRQALCYWGSPSPSGRPVPQRAGPTTPQGSPPNDTLGRRPS